MTKKIIIIASALLILTIGGIWVYALLNPNPTGGNGLFANFGAGEDAEEFPPIIGDVEDFEDGTEEGREVRLRQLTTNPVAGAVFAQNGILYVEQGTGHIRYINLMSGEETLVSGTTIPGAYEATFSESGEFVAITTTEDGAAKTIIATVPEVDAPGNLDGVALPLGAVEVNMAKKPGVAYYLIRSSEGSRGYAYSIEKNTSTELFSIPLRDVHVLWGEPVYVYTTPTYTQTGYVYEVAANGLDYITSGQAGLMAFRHEDEVVVTKKGDASDFWFSTMGTGSSAVSLGGPVIPEKCVSGDMVIWCGVPDDIGREFPDSWYKGSSSLSDSLWRIDEAGETASVASDFLVESGRQIDVLRIGVDPFETYLYLINKNDNTLWLYRIEL